MQQICKIPGHKKETYILICLTIGLIFNACSTDKSNKIENTVKAYYQVYSERQDFEKFLDFYDDDMILEDMISGDRMIGKEAFRNFFDWGNSNFELLGDSCLIVKEQVIHDNQSITTGYFTPFKWGEYECEPMHFTTILTFNEAGKIIKHVDWINYPSSLIDYDKRKNSNKWID